MPNINILALNYSDNQNQLIQKTNNNFDEIVELHGGSQGLTGPTGAMGAIGEMGGIGPTGVSGPRGTRWFVDNTQPYGSGNYIEEGDYWVNSITGEIYILTYTGWEDSGYNFNSSGSIFSQVVSVYDSTLFPVNPSGITGSSIIENQVIPSDYTFVVADDSPESGILNENLSKFVISTNETRNSGYILEFSKSNIETGQIADYSLHPYFRWRDSGTSNASLVLDVPGGAFDIGASGGFEASFNNLNIASPITFDLEMGSTSGSGMFVTGGYQINAPNGSFNLISQYFSITGASASFYKPVTMSSTLAGGVPIVYVYSGGTSGFKSSRSGDTYNDLSNSVYHLKLETNSGNQLSLDTKGKLKINKGDEAITYPNNVYNYAAGSNNYWYLLCIPEGPAAEISSYSGLTPVDSGNTLVLNPPISTSFTGIAIYTGSDYGWGSTGGLLPGQSIDINVHLDSDGYTGYWETSTGSYPSSGILNIGYGTTAGITTVATFDQSQKPLSVDFTIMRGATGPLTTVYYRTYTGGTASTYGGSGGYFAF